MKLLKLLPIVFIALAMIACSFTVNVPTVDTGVSQTLEINEAALNPTGTNEISIEMGAGTLSISAGASQLVEGTVRYNIETWAPNISRSSDELRITQRSNTNIGIPDGDIKNDWTLQFGDFPIDLTLNAGAYEGNLDLSGLAITNLSISDGASKATVEFKSPNPVEMEELIYKTGASDVELLGLGYANVKEIYFDSGVGSFTLDFSGDLQNDILVRANSGMSDMTIIIPSTAQARVIVNGGLSNVDANGTWTISGSTYTCGNNGPMITINLDMAVGNLNLRQE